MRSLRLKILDRSDKSELLDARLRRELSRTITSFLDLMLKKLKKNVHVTKLESNDLCL